MIIFRDTILASGNIDCLYRHNEVGEKGVLSVKCVHTCVGLENILEEELQY